MRCGGQRGRLELSERVAWTPEAASWWRREETKGLRVNIETKREHGFIESRWEGVQEWAPFKDNTQSISEGVGQGPWCLSSKYRDLTSSKEGTGHRAREFDSLKECGDLCRAPWPTEQRVRVRAVLMQHEPPDPES